jgi:hypothetical protein
MKFKKKLRIQTFDSEGFQINDRLVEQDIEFYQGPKEAHEGPMRLEINLWEKDDVEKCLEYIQKLSGKLPIVAPGSNKPKKLKGQGKIILAPEQREELIKAVKDLETQDQIISLLRDQGFEFLTWDYINSLGLETGISQAHQNKYQWMLKLVKKAKNPLNNKFDPMLAFGFKLIGKKINVAVIYLFKEKHKILKKPWDDKTKVSFKTTDMIKFPSYMIQEEKDKFIVERDTLRRFKDRKPSKFFLRWIKDVEFKDKEELLKRAND